MAVVVREREGREALAYLERALDAEPWSPRLLEARADVLFEIGSFAAAADSYRSLLQVDPDSADGHRFLGLALVRLGHWATALPHIERALELRPDDPVALDVLESLRAARPRGRPPNPRCTAQLGGHWRYDRRHDGPALLSRSSSR